jgi:predicted Rossmann fold nucleotide-binding protein DprA/Smf involved in DNA uptake
VYSGGARGVDGLAMQAALAGGGKAVGILADSLEKAIRSPEVRAALEAESLAVLTPFAPKTGFSVGTAMARNKLIYALSDYALVVSSDAGKGGTWTGATEALKARWVPIFVCEMSEAIEGNRQLLQRGATPFPYPFPGVAADLGNWLTEQAKPELSQPTLF